jgi:hypothetical protein
VHINLFDSQRHLSVPMPVSHCGERCPRCNTESTTADLVRASGPTTVSGDLMSAGHYQGQLS